MSSNSELPTFQKQVKSFNESGMCPSVMGVTIALLIMDFGNAEDSN
jgi:hypothetical protein